MVKFANGTTLDTIAVYGGNMQYQDAQRKTMEIVCEADVVTLEAAKALWSDPNATKEITITETVTQPVTVNAESGEMVVSNQTSTVQSVHLNFTLPVELKLMALDGKDVVRIKLAQKSALEIAQEQQAADINDTQLALIELADIVAGGTQ